MQGRAGSVRQHDQLVCWIFGFLDGSKAAAVASVASVASPEIIDVTGKSLIFMSFKLMVLSGISLITPLLSPVPSVRVGVKITRGGHLCRVSEARVNFRMDGTMSRIRVSNYEHSSCPEVLRFDE